MGGAGAAQGTPLATAGNPNREELPVPQGGIADACGSDGGGVPFQMARRYKIVVAGAALALCCLIGLRAYDHFGKRSGNGFYTSASATVGSGPCFDFHQASSHAGENGCVSGFVLRAFTSKAGNTFLDFCSDYKTCPFSSVIFASDRNKFGNLEALAGRQVEIRGLITTYNGHAEIIIREPAQIQAAP